MTIGEQQLSPQIIQQIAPDVASGQGQQQLQAKAIAAGKMKQVLDSAFQLAAKHIGAESSSRVKSIDTAAKKIAQKRLEGRDYGIEDINDMLGLRLVVKQKADFPKAEKEIASMADSGLFKITKKEQVHENNYQAMHYDLLLPDGTKAEAQIHTPQSEAEAVANHDLRAIFGQKLPDHAQTLADTQAQIIKQLPTDKASAIAKALKTLHSGNSNQPIDPMATATLLSQAKQ